MDISIDSFMTIYKDDFNTHILPKDNLHGDDVSLDMQVLS